MSTKKALKNYLLFSVIALLTAGVVFAVELFFYPQHTLGDSVAVYIAFNGMLLSLSVISLIPVSAEKGTLIMTRICIFIVIFVISWKIPSLIVSWFPSTFFVASLFPDALFFSENRSLWVTLVNSVSTWAAYFIIYLIINLIIIKKKKSKCDAE